MKQLDANLTAAIGSAIWTAWDYSAADDDLEDVDAALWALNHGEPFTPLSPARIEEIYKMIEDVFFYLSEDPEPWIFEEELDCLSGVIKYPEYLTFVFGA